MRGEIIVKRDQNWQMHLRYTSGIQNHLVQKRHSELVATNTFPNFFEEETSKMPSMITQTVK